MARKFGACGEITVQSGGGEVIDSITLDDNIAASTSGELFNIPVGSTERIIITALMPQSATETNIEIKFGTRVVYTGSISDAPVAGALTISQGALNNNTNEYLSASTMHELKGDFGEDLIITKTSGSTGVVIHLSIKVTF